MPYSKIRTPCASIVSKLRCAACCTIGMSEASADGTMMRTSTPRATASPSASIASASGRKYGFWMRMLLSRHAHDEVMQNLDGRRRAFWLQAGDVDLHVAQPL